MKRVVITGMALTSPLGSEVSKAYERLKVFENCIQYWEELDKFKRLNTRLVSMVKDFQEPQDFTRKTKRTMGPLSIMAVTTAKQALEQARLLDNPILTNGQTGVCYGSSSGSLDAVLDFYSMCVDNEVKAINSGSYIKMMSQTACVNLSLYFKTHGYLLNSSTACTSGSMGIGLAYNLIKDGYQKVMIAGGGEEIHPSQIGIFDTLFATSSKNDLPKSTPSPFDRDRDGLVVGEGAGTLILEEYEFAKNRGAKILAEIVGFATNTDGDHVTNPNKDMMANVMLKALENSKLKPEDIGYINAHGTATIAGDIAESNATSEVFGKKVPISSIKSYTGHTLGACGAIEAILSIEMMKNKWFCPTLNLKNVDERCGDLDYIVGNGRNIDCEYVMTNNFAFGGINTSLVIKRV